MELIVIIIMIALLQYIYFGVKVGKARGLYGVKAPETTGHEMFERAYRVQCNTLEQLVIFIPAIWAFGYYVGYIWASALGVIYLIGRVVYGVTYIKDPVKRGPGMLLTAIPTWAMVLGTLAAAIWQIVSA